uniref:Uncharacterized protein n=1 Tax=Nelumbo nucifera TaxID=4432 RepID=A0A822XM53_NELNU|nr:TPA_asm: hypothetical protein HUJ06_024147 [Nelumbo nucifera]
MDEAQKKMMARTQGNQLRGGIYLFQRLIDARDSERYRRQ